MPQQLWTLINGSPFVYPLQSGKLRVDHQTDAGTQSQTYDPVDGKVTFTPAVKTTYYLAFRADDAQPWCPVGRIIVVDLVDATENQLRTELENVNSRIKDAQDSLIMYQDSDPSGSSSMRMTLNRLNDLRAKLEVRLADYYRRQTGGLPMRFA